MPCKWVRTPDVMLIPCVLVDCDPIDGHVRLGASKHWSQFGVEIDFSSSFLHQVTSRQHLVKSSVKLVFL